MARPGQRQAGARRTAPRKQRRVRHRGDVVSVLARTVREVEAAARRGRVTPAVRTKFQAVALLLRDERARVRAAAGTGSRRAEQLKRLDGIAAILATTAVRDAGLLALLAEGLDHDLVRRVARSELKDATTAQSGENVFTMMRRIGQAKAELAADYAAQLARSAGKVVFFAKHVDVMDAAEEIFARQGVRLSSIRGGQTPTARQANVDAFVNDPDVTVAVCSLTAAGVGLNLQIASNIVRTVRRPGRGDRSR